MVDVANSVTVPGTVTAPRGVTPRLLLSLFPGADLLGRGFEQAGYVVTRGPDTLYGQDICRFSLAAVSRAFEGIFGGSPCQDFSRRRRAPPTGYGVKMLKEFCRLVTEAEPDWWLLENVPGVPDVEIAGYTIQRFNLFAAECGVQQLRNRRFQFGSRDGRKLVLQRGTMSQNLLPAALASEDTNRRRRNFADLCELQGLPRSFRLPGLSRSAQFRAVGNGVPVPVAYAVACAIRDRQVTHSLGLRLCECDCGRPVTGRQRLATAACRKRMERQRRAESLCRGRSQGPEGHAWHGHTDSAADGHERDHVTAICFDFEKPGINTATG